MKTATTLSTTIRWMKLGLIAVAIGIVYVSCAPQVSRDDSPLIGNPAKAFSLPTVDGRPAKLSDYKGSVVVMDFWATWCGPCQESMPNLNRLSNDPGLAARGLKVLAVNSQESLETVKGFLDQNHYTMPVALDGDGSVEPAYQVDGLPTTVVVGRDGLVKKVLVGFEPVKSEAALSAAINKALSQ